MTDETTGRDNAVLFHHPDAVDTSREKLMGRHVAGEGFLHGLVRHAEVDRFYCHTMSEAHAGDFVERVGELDERGRACEAVALSAIGDLAANARTLSLPEPGLSIHAWRRREFGAKSYSLCGVHHTISSEGAMQGIGALLTSPVEPWDAVVCTSRAAKAVIERLLDNYADFLGRRGGGGFSAGFQLPVIPLGVDCRRFEESDKTESVRQSVRRGLGIGDEDIAVLFFGRLSFHAKAHPLPMYQALEAAAVHSGRRIHLLQTGRFANAGIEAAFRDGARDICPSVNAIFLDGRDDAVCRNVWCAADVFTSLSDNIQESFGLTPIEAMAAGLPSVVSDWDGYRDTIRPGVDGFAVPTWMPAAGSGGDLALATDALSGDDERDREYNHYCGLVSQCTAVDVAAATEAFTALAENSHLRREMGDAARRRARETFDWGVVIGQYQALWRELAHIRNRTAESAPVIEGRPVHPLRDDPFSLFDGYATETVDIETMVSLAGGITDREAGEKLAALRSQMMNDFAHKAMLSDLEIEALLESLAEAGPSDAGTLAESLAEDSRYRLSRTLTWLAKLGIVALAAPDAAATQSTKSEPEVRKLVELGVNARRRGAGGPAVDYFRKALAAEPNHAEANHHLGELLAASGQLNSAIDCFRRVVEANAGDPAAFCNLGKALFLSGDDVAGKVAIETAVSLKPDDPEANFLLGTAHWRSGATSLSVKAFERALAHDEENSEIHSHLGLSLKALGRREEALAALNRALEIEPDNVFAKAAELSLRHDQEGGASSTALRVGIHMNQRYHFVLLRPLFDALAERNAVLFTGDGRDLVEFAPQVVIAAGAQAAALRRLSPATTFIEVGQSMARKNRFSRISECADFICVVGQTTTDELAASTGIDATRFWATGYIGNDALFRRDLPGLSLPEGRRTVLYAPTWTPTLTSAQMLGHRAAELICGARDDINLIIKPHPRICETRPAWLAAWREMAAARSDVTVVDGSSVDVNPYLLAADVLVSDASGVSLQYLALDRPIILISNPKRHADRRYFEAAAPEWKRRDMAADIHDINDLAAAVGAALDNPAANAPARARHRRELFGDLTAGDAVARVVERLEGLNI